MSPLAAQNRLVAGTLISGLFFITLALFFVLPTDETPPIWVPLAQLGAGVAVHLMVETIGYRPAALDPSLDEDAAVAQGMVRYQGAMILRFALIEAIAIVSIALAFVLPEGGFLTFVGGAVVSFVLMAVHVWPWARPVGRSADALEARGRRSGLRESFGHSPDGPIRL
jgi:hypothetical protein